VTQVTSVNRANHTISSDWIKPFDVCVTEFSICFNSGWHYRCSVTLCNNKWEILMRTPPLLSNARHRVMITPVSPPLTRPFILTRVVEQFIALWNYSRNRNSSLGFTSNVLYKSITSKKHSVRYELFFKTYLAA